MRTSRLTFTCSVLAMLSTFAGVAQEPTTKITFDPTVQRYIGDVTSMDRGKFFNLHGAESTTDVELQKFFSDYGVGHGRQFGGPGDYAYNSTGEYGKYPAYTATPNTKPRTISPGMILTQHPNDKSITKDMDNDQLKLAGEWTAEYLNNIRSVGSAIPEYFEPFNEPFVHAGDGSFSGTTYSDSNMMVAKITEFFKQCAIAIHNCPGLSNVKVIGFSDAWPQYESTGGAFGVWEGRMKLFMDAAGEYMDAYAIHLYDGENVEKGPTNRSGSNSEAVLDLVESYQYALSGTVKPFVISEYGGIFDNGNRTVGSINHILFNLLDRENNLLHSVPFICDKSTWHLNEENNYEPYGAALMVPSEPYDGSGLSGVTWKYTPKVNFYALWKGVQGNRFDITTSNPDIQCMGFRDGSTIYIALDNLEDQEECVSFVNSAIESELTNVEIRRCETTVADGAVYSEVTLDKIPESITMQVNETIIIKATLGGEAATTNAIRRTRCYSKSNVQKITASSGLSYKFTAVPSVNYGRATARMSIGRALELSKSPEFYVNGVSVAVPNDWKGYDQASRDGFFGMIEIPFSTALLNESGEQEIKVVFPDSGGSVSSIILDIEEYDYRPTSTYGYIVNGDFESGKMNWTPLSKGGKATIVSSEEARGGNYVAQIKGEAALAQRFVASVDKSYKVSAWIKSSVSGDVVTVATSNGYKGTSSVSEDYTLVEFNVPTSDEEQEVLVRFENNNEDSTIYIDDIALSVE